jgi:hypothetical protein
VRLTVGGDKLPYTYDAGSPAASLLETKLILNSTISDSDKGAKFLCANLKDHFLASRMKDPEYMRIKYKYFPAAIREQYNLATFLATDGYIYIHIKKGMYGLKQAAILAYTLIRGSRLHRWVLPAVHQKRSSCGCISPGCSPRGLG